MARQKTVLLWMLGALAALGLGQLLALIPSFPGEEPEPQPSGDLWATGVVICREVEISADPGVAWQVCVPDGTRASAGQVLLREWDSAQAQADQTARLRQQALAARTMTLPQRRAAIGAALQALSGTERPVETVEALTALMLGEGETTLEFSAPEATVQATVTAPAAGLFSLGSGTSLTPEAPWGPIPLPERQEEGVAGRLILGDTWYFRTTLPEAAAVGTEVTALLPWSGDTLSMEVVALGPGGQVLLSCRQYLQQVADLRELDVKVMEISP